MKLDEIRKIPSTEYLESQGTNTSNGAWNILSKEVQRLRKFIRSLKNEYPVSSITVDKIKEEIKLWGE